MCVTSLSSSHFVSEGREHILHVKRMDALLFVALISGDHDEKLPRTPQDRTARGGAAAARFTRTSGGQTAATTTIIRIHKRVMPALALTLTLTLTLRVTLVIPKKVRSGVEVCERCV